MRLFRAKDRDPLVYRWFGPTLGAATLFAIEVLQILVIAAAIMLPIRFFIVKPFIVQGASMEPNYFHNEYLIIDQIPYQFRAIERGEVVVFIPPNDQDEFYIKRVVGLPGETVQIEDGIITICNSDHERGEILDEDYIESYTYGDVEVELGEEEYYLLGDNRLHSYDSRHIGSIEESAIIGRAWFRGLPVDRISTFELPDYQDLN